MICRLLAGDFRLRLVQRSLRFSMNCFGAFFCFLAYSLSGFLGLSADGLGSLFGFFSDCFSRFLGFFACGFNSVLDCLPRFLCSLLYFFHCSFLGERYKRRSQGQSNNKARYLHDCLLFICSLVQRKRMRPASCAHDRLSRRQLSMAFAARTFVNGREFRQWDPENIKRHNKPVSQNQTRTSNGFVPPRTRQDPFAAVS